MAACPNCGGSGWTRYFQETTGGDMEAAFSLCSHSPHDAPQPLPVSPERRNDLWHTAKAFDYGPDGNLKQWEEAVDFLDGLANMGGRVGNDAVSVALIDARDRAQEEVRRAKSEVRMRREWASRQPTEADLL